jgi:hypothetical protein
MARTYAQVTVDIWEDPDWLALSQGAQRLYLLLLCQKKLSLIGLLPYTPARWARFAPDTDVADVEAAVAELEAGRFVVIDRETEELLIRTFVRHDITKVSKGATNSKLLKGMWSAWGAIESAELKRVVLREIPDAVWSAERCTPPERALQMRSDSVNRFSESIGESIHGIGSDAPPDQAPRKPRSRRIDSVNRTNESIHRTDSPASCNLHPATQSADYKQPGNSRGDEAHEAAAEDHPDRLSDTERQDRLDAAIEVLVERELERNPTRNGNRQRHADAVRRGKRRDHHLAGHQALVTDPTLTPSELADLLEPPSTKPDREPDPEAVASAERIRKAEAETARRLAEQRQEPPDPELNLSGVSAARSMLPPRLRLVEGA